MGVVPNRIDVESSKYMYSYDDFDITIYKDTSFEVTHNGVTETFNTQEFNVEVDYYLNKGFFEVRSLKS